MTALADDVELRAGLVEKWHTLAALGLELQRQVTDLAQLRGEIVYLLHLAGMSLTDIAREMGVTRTRAQQLVAYGRQQAALRPDALSGQPPTEET